MSDLGGHLRSARERAGISLGSDIESEIVARRIQTAIGIILLVAATAFCIYLDRRDAGEHAEPVTSPSLGAARDVREIPITTDDRTSLRES
jgi:hypothetical protein